MSTVNLAELTYDSLDRNFRSPTTDPDHYPLRLDNQTNNQPRQDLRYNILPVHRINNSLQQSFNTRNGRLIILTQRTAELNFEVILKFNGLNPHPIPTSTQIKHKPFPSRFFVSTLHMLPEEPPFDHHWRIITFHDPFSV